MEQSILKSTKQVLHLNVADDSFDLNIITMINSAFSDLNDLGVGPANGFAIDDDTALWSAFISDDPVQLNQVKTFVLLKARLIFDPPSTSYLVDSAQRQLAELTSRISMRRENKAWVAPLIPAPDPADAG